MPLPLIQRSEEEISQNIRKKVQTVRDIKEVRRLSVRVSGKRLEVDLLVSVSNAQEIISPHRIAQAVENAVRSEYPNARVAVHTEPAENGQAGVWKLVKDTAESTPGSRGVHNIHIQRVGKQLCIDLHLEVSSNMTVKQAHGIADQIESRIKAANPDLSDITVHIESASNRIARELAGVERELESYIEDTAKDFPEIKSVRGIQVRKFGNFEHLILQCQFDPNLKIQKAHEAANRLEKNIRDAYPNITRIDIHEEPA